MYLKSYQIAAYSPALHAEQQLEGAKGQLSVMDGQNFAWDAGSVFSAHGNYTAASPAPTGDAHPADFTIANKQVFLFTTGAYEVVAGAYVPLFLFNLPAPASPYNLTHYKWSYAYVGTKHFFSNPLVGELIWYDEFLDQWGSHRDPCWTGPIYGICHADNRLVLQLVDVVSWSNFDEGLVFDPDFYTGTGCQSLALIRYGQPYGIHAYRDGWLSFTSHGIMVSRPSHQRIPDPTMGDSGRDYSTVTFNHDELSFDNLPVGPAAIVGVEDKDVIWVTAGGFRHYSPASGSNAFGDLQEWQPAMSAFYRDELLPAVLAQASALDYFMLNYSREAQWLFVSSRYTDAEFESEAYSRAHVWQRGLNTWGSFDIEHVHVGFGHHDNAQRIAPNYGFIDGFGNYHVVDHVRRGTRSWVKLTPVRLPIPADFGGALEPQVSVQQVRLGVSRPISIPAQKGGLKSTWTSAVRAAELPTVCDVLVSGGDDSMTPTGDEQEYAQIVARAETVIDYACHVTGTDVNIFIIADSEGFHFNVHHVELGYFFAGVK